MKKILLSLMLFAGLVSISTNTFAAPCSVSNLYFRLNSYVVNPNGSCTINFDFGWDQFSNNGNKWSFAHLWLSEQYPNPALSYGSAPTTANLANALGTIVIDNGVLNPANNAYPNGTATILSGTFSKTAITGGSRYRITGISKTFSVCPASLSIKGDVWSSNSGNGGSVHCFTNNLDFLPPTQNLNLTGTFFCSKQDGTQGREILVNLSSVNAASDPVSVSYNVYVDNGNGSFTPAEETPVPTRTVTGLSVYTGNPYSSGRIDYLPFSNTNPFANRAVWVSVTANTALGQFTRLIMLENSCTALPVTFKSVNANRKNASSVGVSWTTSSEQNNRGFYVQRNDGAGWKNVAFVFSQSVAGTSSSDLSYEYNDANTEKGVSQYRVQQVDLDGKASYSIIRAIRGESVAAKMLVYPNPSATGNINVVFDSNSGVRDVMVSDAAGRLVKTFRSITNNNLQIENLKRGFYTLKVTNRTTASSSVEKVVVK